MFFNIEANILLPRIQASYSFGEGTQAFVTECAHPSSLMPQASRPTGPRNYAAVDNVADASWID